MFISHCCCCRRRRSQVLTKSYHMLDDDEPVLERSEGTEIDWKAGKNITVKVGSSSGVWCAGSGLTAEAHRQPHLSRAPPVAPAPHRCL